MNFFKRLFGIKATQDEFADLVMQAARRRGFAGKLDYDPEEFEIAHGESGHFFLNNAYRDYCQAQRRNRSAVIEKYASLFMVGEETRDVGFDEAKAHLLPRVQSRAYHSTIRLVMAEKDGSATDATVTAPLSDELAVDLVVDHEDTIQTVTRKQLEEWKVSFEEALKVAKENLWRRSNEEWGEVATGLHMSPWQDTHDAGRLFLHDLVWQLPVKGKHVAFAINRVHLLVTGDEDPEGLAAMAAVAQQLQDQDRPVASTPVRLDGNRWASWLPARDHPAFELLNDIRLRRYAIDYEEQTKLLEKHAQDRNWDVFVAAFNVSSKDEKNWITWAIWIDGCDDALLPRCEWIHLLRHIADDQEPQKLGWVSFKRAREVAPELFEKTDYFPPRYRLRGFPTAEQIEAMGVREEPF